MTLTYYDAAMAGVVVAGMIWGAWRGVTWQLASLASLVVGYFASHRLTPELAPHFGSDPMIARSLAMMASYAVVSGGVFLVAWTFRAILRKMKFEAFDRHLGMLLGGVEGAILGVVATFFVVSLMPQTHDTIYTSPTGKLVSNFIDAVGPKVKEETGTALAPFLQEAKHPEWTFEKVAPLLPAAEAEINRTSHTDDGTAERR